MSGNPNNVVSGVGKFYYGAFGAVEPTDASMSPYTAPDSSVWTDVGDTSGGFVWEDDLPSTDLIVDQRLRPIGARYVAGTAMTTITVALAESTLANYAIIMNNMITSTSGTGWAKQEAQVGGLPPVPTYGAVLLDGWAPGGFRRRLIGRKALSKPKVQKAFVQDGKISTLAATWTLYEVSDSIPAWANIDQTA
jgi:hypothetical protein